MPIIIKQTHNNTKPKNYEWIKQNKRGDCMENIATFILSVAAGIIANCITYLLGKL